MKRVWLLSLFCVLVGLNLNVFAQSSFQSREISEDDGVPVLIKHLPDWENARNRALLTNKVEDLRNALGARPVFDLVDFTGGHEAITAPYDAGKLLIIEYVTPQASVEADKLFQQKLIETNAGASTVYRRIGNYNAFVFDVKDAAAANALLDQIKYEKTVQWLGEDPNLQQRLERHLARTTAEMFVSTAIAIVLTLGTTVLIGVAVGLVFFRIREQKRSTMRAFSDAGGMVRLNLDDLTPSALPENLLKD